MNGGDDELRGLLGESLRALRPGAPIYLHGLAGDRPCRGTIALPGPAAAVRHVPATSAVVEGLKEAGFVDVRIEKLSEAVHFIVDGVPMRELRAAGRKPGYRPKTAAHHAVYLGPMDQAVDDFGNVFRRGVPTPLNIHDWQVLSSGAAKDAFLFLKPGEQQESACCDQAEAAPAGASSR